MNGLNLYSGSCPGCTLDYNTTPTQRVNDHLKGKIQVSRDSNNNKRKMFVFNLFLLDIFDLFFQFCVLSWNEPKIIVLVFNLQREFRPY